MVALLGPAVSSSSSDTPLFNGDSSSEIILIFKLDSKEISYHSLKQENVQICNGEISLIVSSMLFYHDYHSVSNFLIISQRVSFNQ